MGRAVGGSRPARVVRSGPVALLVFLVMLLPLLIGHIGLRACVTEQTKIDKPAHLIQQIANDPGQARITTRLGNGEVKTLVGVQKLQPLRRRRVARHRLIDPA